MNLHEYQAKVVLQKYGIPVPEFYVISSVEELQTFTHNASLEQGVIKIQVHAGGRGKAGGVKIARNREEILSHGKQLLGMKMVNRQTGPQGVIARQILISPLIEIKKEYYLGAVIDRQKGQATLIASPSGGMEIEEVAAQDPSQILKLAISDQGTLRGYQLIHLCKFMGWKDSLAEQGSHLASQLAKAFVECDASLIEINPLVETPEGKLWALDAKLSVDDNALFRHPELVAFSDPSQLTPEEAQAKEFDLAYVGLDGEIGCMVNGAGLAMATMDIIHLNGGKPANFLDVGGGASKEKVAAGFKIILSDPKVKAILINIFGGIMNCETLAQGIVEAASQLQIRVPLVVRMEGTNVEQGKKILADSKLPIIIAQTLEEAAQKVVSVK